MVLIASRQYGNVAVLGNLCKVHSLNLFLATVCLHICTVKKIAVRSFRFLNGQRS